MKSNSSSKSIHSGGRGSNQGRGMLNNILCLLPENLIINYQPGATSTGNRGRGDGRGGGKNLHMGQLDNVNRLMSGNYSRDILTVIRPEQNERLRDNPIVELPEMTDWRLKYKIGRNIDSTVGIVYANHFKVNISLSSVFHYNIQIFPVRNGNISNQDIAPIIDNVKAIKLVNLLCDNHKEWMIGKGTGFTFDGKSNIYSSRALLLSDKDREDRLFVRESITIKGQINDTFVVVLTQVSILPINNLGSIRDVVLSALDSSLFATIRSQSSDDNPEWFIVGSSVFKTSESINLSPIISARKGYYASLKVCLSGLVLVSDIVVSTFFEGGAMLDYLAYSAEMKSSNEFIQFCYQRKGKIPNELFDRLANSIRGLKIKILYLGQLRKCKSFGQSANNFKFSYENKEISVATYFKTMCLNSNPENAKYKRYLPEGLLKFPDTPTINIGNEVKPILIPCELIEIVKGQCASRAATPDIVSQLVRHAAVPPNERMQSICGKDGIVGILRNDSNFNSFGMSTQFQPLAVAASILPPGEVQYGNNAICKPGLSGTWNLENRQFYSSASNSGRPLLFSILAIGQYGSLDSIRVFIQEIELSGKATGCIIKMNGNITTCTNDPRQMVHEIESKLLLLRDSGSNIVFVIIPKNPEVYGQVKYKSDMNSIVTQCIQWKNIEKPPRGFHGNVLMKVNVKLGGINHILSNRIPNVNSTTSQTQAPIASLSWVFEERCMLVGMDVSHADRNQRTSSVAAIVASMDSKCVQYAGHVSLRPPGQEMFGEQLEDSMQQLLESFRSRTGGYPKKIIIFRDGVSDSQFQQVFEREVPYIRNAIAFLGLLDVKLTILICQKGHHTRLVFKPNGEDAEYLNVCPGVVVDARSRENENLSSISSPNHIDFLLNSHAAIQGTCKPCKYVLLLDEIGFRLSEIELLTYWSTYLYVRANKSVSIATPAYYAHWLSKRGRSLLSAGADNNDLLHVSNIWIDSGRKNPMFFI